MTSRENDLLSSALVISPDAGLTLSEILIGYCSGFPINKSNEVAEDINNMCRLKELENVLVFTMVNKATKKLRIRF